MIRPCYQFNTNSLTFGRPSEHWWDSWFCLTQAQVKDSSSTGLGFNSWRWTSHLSPDICQLWALVHNIKDRRSERTKPTAWSHCSYKTEQTCSKSPIFTPKHLLIPRSDLQGVSSLVSIRMKVPRSNSSSNSKKLQFCFLIVPLKTWKLVLRTQFYQRNVLSLMSSGSLL